MIATQPFSIQHDTWFFFSPES